MGKTRDLFKKISKDVVRHPLVAEIIKAYTKYEEKLNEKKK